MGERVYDQVAMFYFAWSLSLPSTGLTFLKKRPSEYEWKEMVSFVLLSLTNTQSL